MEFLSLIVEKIVDPTIKPLVRQVGYVIYMKSNIENLKGEVEKLATAKERVQHCVDEALRNFHKIEADVERWQRRVDEIIAEANGFLEEESQFKKKCLFGLCPDLISSRYRPSRKAIKLAQKVVGVRNEGDFPNGISYKSPPKEILTILGYMAFESRSLIVDQIKKKLKDSNIHMIGVYGLPGIGKSTLVKEIARQAEKEKLFDNVVRVEVRQNPDLKRIQKEIAEKFGLELDDNKTDAVRACLLCDYIKKKKVLLILDDVWEKLELEALGLPFGICKILLTSRNRHVLFEIGMQEYFPMEFLKEEETWSLFENTVGDVVSKEPNIRDVAIEIAIRCSGLPILAVTLAKTLRGEKLHSWKEALRLQKEWKGKEMQEQAVLGIEWCYDQLKDEELKSLFLFCCVLGGRVHFLEDLLKYIRGLGLSLFDGINTTEDARNKLHALVDKLKHSCLLPSSTTEEEVDDDQFVRMHDLTCEAGRKIASRDRQFLSGYGNEFRGWPRKEILKKCTFISFKRIDISQLLLEQLECPELQLFCLSDTRKSLPISDNFFIEMKQLRVLDLSTLCIPSLPSSIVFLTNLQTLCLDRCKLRNIVMVGELRSLEILSLLKSKFKLLPKEIGKLTRLQVLDLSGCSDIEVIHPNIISCLTKLEELRMNNNFNNWEIEQVGSINERSNASLSEIQHLPNLTRLDINIRDASQLPLNCFSEKLINFNISVGDVWNWSHKYSVTSKRLNLKLSETNKLDQGLQTLLKKCEDIHLDVLEEVNDAVCQLNMEGFQRLKNLHVQNNPEIFHILNCGSSHIAFPILKELHLCNLASLKSLCSGQLLPGSFSQLSILKVEKCPNLKNLFSLSAVQQYFLQLQQIEVIDCKNMKDIVDFEAQVNDGIEFCPQLLSLKLQSLPQLTCFASNNEIYTPMALFNNKEKVAFPKLVENLSSLIVDGCNSLRFLSSSSMAINFVQLKKLRISRCQNMVEIISWERYDGIEENMDHNKFPKLESLEMDTLPNLETFCSSPTFLNFLCLNSLEIIGCTKLGPFIHDRMSIDVRDADLHYLFDDKVGFPSLEKLIIEGVQKLRTIWHTQLHSNSFCKLAKIWVDGCPSLIHLLDPCILQSLRTTLNVLDVKRCDSLEVVFTSLTEPHHELENFSCRNLCEVEIWWCRSLKNVFPAFVAKNRNLEKLKKLKILGCEKLEEIVGEVGVEMMPKFEFPSAKEVWLQTLPLLSSFYPGMHSSMWPSLIDLSIFDCDKLERLAVDSSCFQLHQQQQEQLGIPIYKQGFFLYEKGSFSILKNLTLKTKEVIYASLPQEFFKIEHLQINCNYIRSTVPLSIFFQQCHNLQQLLLVDGNIEEIFIQDEYLDGKEHQVGHLTQLKLLTIFGMSKLMHIWKHNPNLGGPIFPNLEILKVINCGRLESIMSSAITFSNIINLQVFDCDGLKHLITYSVAKSLVSLKWLEVRNCLKMIEIVASDDEEVGDAQNEICFSGLEYLELSNLPDLKGFCSRNYNVTFPLFITISVLNCIEMKISDDGVLLNDSKRTTTEWCYNQLEEEEEEEEEEEDDDDDDEDDDDDNDDDYYRIIIFHTFPPI